MTNKKRRVSSETRTANAIAGAVHALNYLRSHAKTMKNGNYWPMEKDTLLILTNDLPELKRAQARINKLLAKGVKRG